MPRTLALATALAAACTPTGDTGAPAASVVHFAVITDPHLRGDPEHANGLVLEETVAVLDAMVPPLDLVLIAGDLVDDLPSDDPAWYESNPDTPLHRAEVLLAALQTPWLAVLGNHDYYLSGGSLENDLTDDFSAREALFGERLGLAPWFRHDLGGVAFYGLNTMKPHPKAAWMPESCGSFGPEQVAWLDAELADGVPAILFFHHPLALDNAVDAGFATFTPFEVPRAEGGYEKYEGTEYEGWTDPIYEVLERHAEQILGVFVGHGHWWVRDTYQGVPVMMSDSVGNSILQTAVGEGDDAVPMRYHRVEVEPGERRLTVLNADQFSYDP